MKVEMPKSIYPRSIGDEKFVFNNGNTFAIAVQQKELKYNLFKDFELVYRTTGVRVIVVSPDKTKVLLTYESNRYDQLQDDIRVPGGKVYKNVNDYLAAKIAGKLDADARQAAIRELTEEAGIEAVEMEYLEHDRCNGGVELTLYWYIVSKYTELPNQNLDPGEYITTKWVTIDEAIEMCKRKFGELRIGEDRTRGVLLPFLLRLKEKIA